MKLFILHQFRMRRPVKVLMGVCKSYIVSVSCPASRCHTGRFCHNQIPPQDQILNPKLERADLSILYFLTEVLIE